MTLESNDFSNRARLTRISSSQIPPTAPDSSPSVGFLILSLQVSFAQTKLQLSYVSILDSCFFFPFHTTTPHTHTTTTTTTTMPSFTPPSKKGLSTLLETARPFLRGDLESVHPTLPPLVATLQSVGAGECWHKHGTFLAHLTEVYRILKLWSAPDPVALCGLYHSAYSNSYVNLAIFDPSTSRDRVRGLVGESAERLVHLFCVVNRQRLIHDDLLFRYSDRELVGHQKESEESLRRGKENGVFDGSESWRKKLQSLLPADGIKVKHIRTGEDVKVSRRVVAAFLLMTMADFSDQLFGFQDKLFDNDNGRLEFTGNSPLTTLWPGDGKPGLWLNSISRMGALYMLIAREEELYLEQRKKTNPELIIRDRDEDIEMVIPPMFEGCTKVLDAEEQKEARDLYWEAVYNGGRELGLVKVEELLLKCIEKNGYVGEPSLVLGQVYLGMGRFEEAEERVERGVRLMLEWGSGWDKRVSWEGWVAWGRVMLMKAKERDWPQTSWGILNLGLVK